MSIGLALVIIAGHMDLSVESVAALSAMAVGILFCSGGIGISLQLNPAWLAVPVSLLIALAVGALIGSLNGFLIVKMKMNAFIITLASYIWVRGLVLAVSGGRSAQDLAPLGPLVRHPAPARLAVDCLAGDFMLCRLLTHHGQDAIRPASHHDRGQRNCGVPRRHSRQPQSRHRLHPGRRHRWPCRLGAGDPHLRRHCQSRHRLAVQRLCRSGDRRRQPERRRRLAARRLCRRSLAVGHQHGDQFDGPSCHLHAGHPWPAGAGGGAARHVEANDPPEAWHERPAGRQGRADRRRGARHRQGHRFALRRGGRKAGAGRQRGGSRAGDRRRARRRLHRHRYLAAQGRRGRRRAGASSATAGSTSSSRMPASIPGN